MCYLLPAVCSDFISSVTMTSWRYLVMHLMVLSFKHTYESCSPVSTGCASLLPRGCCQQPALTLTACMLGGLSCPSSIQISQCFCGHHVQVRFSGDKRRITAMQSADGEAVELDGAVQVRVIFSSVSHRLSYSTPISASCAMPDDAKALLCLHLLL